MERFLQEGKGCSADAVDEETGRELLSHFSPVNLHVETGRQVQLRMK